MDVNTNKTPFPGDLHQTADGGMLVTKLDDMINWARANSLWPLVFGTSWNYRDEDGTRTQTPVRPDGRTQICNSHGRLYYFGRAVLL